MKEKVVIIGAGVLGAATAAALSKAGYEVTVLEKSCIAGAASGANEGQISLVDRAIKWHMELALESLEYYKDMVKKYPIEFDLSGGSVVIEAEDEIETAKEFCKVMAEYGVHCNIYLGEDIKKIQPAMDSPKVLGILHCAEEGTINPLKTVMAFVDIAKENGAEIYEYNPVTGFQLQDGKIHSVITDTKEFPADYIINCAGSWASEIGRLAGTEIKLQWRRGTAMATAPTKQVISGMVCGHEVLADMRASYGGYNGQSIGLGVVQAQNGNILIAQATEHTEVDDKEVSPSGICRIAANFLEYYPSLEDMEIIRIYAAVTPFSTDGNPFFGFSEKVKNLLTVAGFKGAFTTAPAVARHVLELLEGTSTWEISDFYPERTI